MLKAALPRQWISLAHARHLNSDAGEYEITRIDEHVDPQRSAIDVGSHNGIYSYHLLGLAKGVVAFEANPPTAAFIRRALPTVSVQNIALSSREGVAILRIPKKTASQSLDGQATIDSRNPLGNAAFDSVEVPTRTLDSFGYTNVGFVKIDVEGHEEDVLAGAQGLIAASRPTFMIEIEERHNPGSLQRIVSLFDGHDYGCHFYVPTIGKPNWRLAPLSEYEAAIHQRHDLVEQLDRMPRRSVPYVNNFLFIPR